MKKTYYIFFIAISLILTFSTSSYSENNRYQLIHTDNYCKIFLDKNSKSIEGEIDKYPYKGTIKDYSNAYYDVWIKTVYSPKGKKKFSNLPPNTKYILCHEYIKIKQRKVILLEALIYDSSGKLIQKQEITKIYSSPSDFQWENISPESYQEIIWRNLTEVLN